jgi:Plant ATP synthase F0
MPQLDALTYFTQFVYLLLSFVASYMFALNFVIPKIISAQKLRQKLNSIAQVTSKLDHSDAQHNAILYASHENLLSSNWYACSKLSKSWPSCARMLQMGSTLRLKKLFCSHTVMPYKL